MARRKTGGRKAGTPNKATAVIKEAAQAYTEMALGVLVEVAESQEAPPAARVMASNSILDRGHGKPTQGITGEMHVSLAELLSPSDARG